MNGEVLGAHALTSARAWALAVLSTWLFSEGAGFGVLAYDASCRSPDGLFYTPILPAGDYMSLTFTAAQIWVNGFYYIGMTFGFLCALSCLVLASRLTRRQIAVVFSWPVFAAVSFLAAIAGYGLVVSQIASSGQPLCAV